MADLAVLVVAASIAQRLDVHQRRMQRRRGINVPVRSAPLYSGPMHVARRKFTAWLVSIALLFVALGPAFAHVSSAWAGDAAAWSEICTSQGLVRADDAGAQSGDDAGSSGAHTRAHCPCCLTQHADVVVPATTHVLAPSGEFARVHVCSAWFLPSPSPAWSPSRPRGPPAVS